ncbi:DUF5695 domain-containing protein [Aliifodinibius sp. S!AR15-10]|uniref:DUF5695 domain-containing protein n=1 Tax=Aliifodinibius sp. S!AR15-10 TaxID=2950437 RepID=UPI002860F17B|nr:DUF5695 domain-containing protein [Aliifodinibius sp. S!AR15-10]MDR8390624.1 DUF5695 domain-containing protein [Aliifodinibius sp. S!AR15-10]
MLRFFKISGCFLLTLCCALICFIPGTEVNAQQGREGESDPPALRLDEGVMELETPQFNFRLVRSSQTVAGLQPKGADGFDFTPSGELENRDENGFYHLGDLTMRLRMEGSKQWQEYSTAEDREPVNSIDVSGNTLAAADLGPTFSWDMPLDVTRYWEIDNSNLVLRFELTNNTDQTIEIGALGMPMVFNNILSGKDLDTAHAVCSFYDPYIGRDAGYLQVTRLNGHGPALLVVPNGKTPFEAYKPLNEDRTQRGITFEGFYEWMVHSKAFAEDEWSSAEPWNPPSSEILEPTQSRSYSVKFLLSDSIRNIEQTLTDNDRPVAVGLPGYVLPMDQQGHLYLKHSSDVQWIDVEPTGSLVLSEQGTTPNGWKAYAVRGREWGRSRVTVTYEDGLKQSINYKVIKPETQVVDDLGRFLTTVQWYDNPDDPFNRTNSVISYDYGTSEKVTEDNRAWIAGLSDEGGAGAWLAAIMKQLVQPEKEEIEKLEQFVDDVVWGGLQYSEGEQKFAVRKSMFYYEPEEMPEGTYNSDVRYGGWSSWDREEARSVGRSYNYPHVAALHWVMYRLARNHEGLVTNHSWDWYLERAYQTGEAMVDHAPHYAQYGQMEGTVFLLILKDMQREGWTEKAKALESTMRERAEVWRSLGFPFGSEMPWDSTGQEEVYAWCRYFGFDAKAQVTLNAILGYMPTVPHWGYNGSARRYWDFLFAGDLSRIERQLHHYGSGLNAIPVLTEFRDNPEDMYLLRVGYGGVMGAISNITQDGFGPAGFHAYPSTLRIDYYSGDYGPGFFGHAVNTGTYLVEHPKFGWHAFGGNLHSDGDWITVKPLDSARSRVYLASVGLWLTLDSGKFETVSINSSSGDVQVELASSTGHTPVAKLNVEQPADLDGVGSYDVVGDYEREREAYFIPLKAVNTVVELSD